MAQDKFPLKVEKLTYGGNGLGFFGNKAVFVSQSAPGDEIEAAWEKEKNSYGIARISRLIKPSPLRVSPSCRYFSPLNLPPLDPPLAIGNSQLILGCGGCQWQMVSYDSQLQAKKDIIAEIFERIGGIPRIRLPLRDCVGMANPWNYRNKVQYPLGRSADGSPILGYYARQSHRVIDIEECPVQFSMFDAPLQKFREFIQMPGVPIYDERNHQGLIRHFCLRGSERTGEMLIILVAKARLPKIISEKILRTFIPDFLLAPSVSPSPALRLPSPSGRPLAGFAAPGAAEGLIRGEGGGNVVGVIQNINPSRTNVIYGPMTETLRGRSYYYEKILDKTFKISATSFFQTNTGQAENIVQRIMESLPSRIGLAVDVYSGVGLFSIFMAPRAQSVIAIEENLSSFEDARENARINRAENVRWVLGKAEEVLSKMAVWAEVILVDPPREGLRPAVIEAFLKRPPGRLIYLSCDPATLARDVKLLTRRFKLEEVAPFDLFPHTYHIETLVFLKSKTS